MSTHMKVVLGLSVVMAAAGFLNARQSSTDHDAVGTPASAAAPPMVDATGADTQQIRQADVVLTLDSVEALRASNSDLESRIAALEAEKADADRLIALKTARLQTLEKQ